MNQKLITTIFSILILGTLVMLGSARALIVEFVIPQTTAALGDVLSFIITPKIEAGDLLLIENITLTLSGPEKITCTFLMNGTLLTKCPGITVKLLSGPTFGYGYGYLRKAPVYNVSLDTSLIQTGNYSTKVIVDTTEKTVEQKGENVLVTSKNLCSVRARDGELVFKNLTFKNSKLNFHIRKKGGASGQGSLTAQTRDGRFSYSFTIIAVIGTGDPEIIKARTIGNYRLGPTERTNARAILTFDKSTNTVMIDAADFDLTGSKVTFKKGC